MSDAPNAVMPERTRYDINDAHDVFDHLHELDTLWDRVELMQEHLPGWPTDRIERAMPHFLGLSAHRLERVLQYADPTGETAVGFRRQP